MLVCNRFESGSRVSRSTTAIRQRQLCGKSDDSAVSLKLVRIDDKTLVLRNLVVQRTPWCVGRFRLPVHTTAAGRPGSFVHRID